MSLPLVDFRGRISHETDAVLETQHQLTGKDKAELLREVMHKWAVLEINASMVLHQQLQSKGLLRDYEGGQGK